MPKKKSTVSIKTFLTLSVLVSLILSVSLTGREFFTKIQEDKGKRVSVQERFQASILDGFVIQTPSNLPHGEANSPYNETFALKGGVAPFTWQLVTGDLPKGINFEESIGELAGRTQETGTFIFIVRVEDSLGSYDENLFKLNIVSTVEAFDSAQALREDPVSEPKTTGFFGPASMGGPAGIQVSCSSPTGLHPKTDTYKEGVCDVTVTDVNSIKLMLPDGLPAHTNPLYTSVYLPNWDGSLGFGWSLTSGQGNISAFSTDPGDCGTNPYCAELKSYGTPTTDSFTVYLGTAIDMTIFATGSTHGYSANLEFEVN